MIVDAHTHLFPPEFLDRRADLVKRDRTFGEMYSSINAPMITSEELIRSMDRNDIDIAVVAGIGWENQELARESNHYIAESVQKFSDRLIGFCSVNPGWHDSVTDEVEQWVRAGIRGIGELHLRDEFFLDSGMASLLRLGTTAGRLGIPVLVHASEPVGHIYPGKGTTFPNRLVSLFEACPDTCFIAAHWGGGLPFYNLMPEIAQTLENVYFDCAASPFLYSETIFQIVAELVGPNKILFGTDFPLVKPQILIEQIRNSHLAEDVQEMILGGNAARLFNIDLGTQENVGKSPWNRI